MISDLTVVSYVDSSGVGILMMCHAKLKKAGGPWLARNQFPELDFPLELRNFT